MTDPNSSQSGAETPIVALPPAKQKEAPKAKSERTDLPPLPTFVEDTLGERGARLPIGFAGPEGLNRHFEARNWTTRLEKEVNRVYKGEKGAARRVSVLVSTLVSNIDGKDWGDDFEVKLRKNAVSGMYAADVFYIYCYLRRDALGDDLKMKVQCPRCDREFPWIADLSTLEVRSVEKEKDLEWNYPILKPFTLRGQKVTSLRMGVQRWNAVELLTQQFLEEGWLKPMTVASCVLGLNDSKDATVVAAHELEDMHKIDLEYLVDEINNRFVGPKMSLELNCQYDDCKAEIIQMINWRYGDFFSVSSR